MPEGKHKSKTYRKVFVRTPGSRTVVHYRRRKPVRAHCSKCKTPLAGTLRELPLRMRNIPKTAKRPERPYGGMLCSSCMRAFFKEQARRSDQ